MGKQQAKSVAVAVNPETDEQLEQQRRQLMDAFWQTVERIGERNADMDPDAELAFITEVVEEVRQERYEQGQTQTKDGC